MNSLEYLNQISTPVKSPVAKPSLLSGLNKKVILIALGIIAALIIAIIAVSYFSSRSTEIPELAPLNSLYLRIDNLSKTIDSYNDKIKSPALRSSGRSLAVILSNDKTELSSLLASDYGEKVSALKLDSALSKEIADYQASLEKARLNGLLDRTYASELAYQVSILLIYETSASEKTSNSKVKTFLSSSSESLETLKSDLEKFSNL